VDNVQKRGIPGIPAKLLIADSIDQPHSLTLGHLDRIPVTPALIGTWGSVFSAVAVA
jgi:hypothetical protein